MREEGASEGVLLRLGRSPLSFFFFKKSSKEKKKPEMELDDVVFSSDNTFNIGTVLLQRKRKQRERTSEESEFVSYCFFSPLSLSLPLAFSCQVSD